LSSGHLIGSSSKSKDRFLVNFHTKNPTTPRTAIPPATLNPTIVPVPTPLESPLLSWPDVGVGDEVEEDVCVLPVGGTVTNAVDVFPV